MQRTNKPTHKCYTCPLNLGKYCWAFEFPREQWQGKRCCTGLSSARLHGEFEYWQKSAHVKTPHELRQTTFPKGRNLQGTRTRLRWI